ncbi:MAG: ATP synthase subunit I [Desulforhopalus sp.]
MAGNGATLQKMQRVGLAVLVVMTLVSATVGSLSFAGSVLVGGIISICSFWVANKDVVGLIDAVSSLSSVEDRKAQALRGQKGYLLKFWLRIAIIGVVLLLLIKSRVVNIFGLILGLSTVVLTVVFISLNVAVRYVFRGRR